MGTTMLPVTFGTLLMVIWLETPFYWGCMHLSLWGPVIWSVLVATVAVATNTKSRYPRPICGGAAGW
jgi:hypothetical protein